MIFRGEMSGAALREACATGNIFVVSKIIAGASDVSGMRSKIESGLSIGMVRIHRQSLKDVVNERDSKTLNAPVHLACLSGAKDCLELLLATGECNATASGSKGQSAAAFCAYLGRYDCMRLLLEQSSAINVNETAGENQWNLLQMAAAGGHYACVALLLEYGASINTVNCDGNTALHLANMANHIDVGRLLRDAGADCKIRNLAMMSAIDVCASSESRALFSASPIR